MAVTRFCSVATMIRRLHQTAVWLCGLALLVNLAAQATAGVALAATAAERPDGPVIVICSPDGIKRLVWTPEGFEPLPGDPDATKPSCPFCSLASASALLPESLFHRLSWATPQVLSRPGRTPLPVSWSGAAAPPARAPPAIA